MAVVQISKIQVRRGQKNSNSVIPQLSSAEFAWSVDSQELYIGNGSGRCSRRRAVYCWSLTNQQA